MAMVKCKECSKDVSSSAKTCPHCGIESPGLQVQGQIQPQTPPINGWAALAVFVVLFAFIGWLVNSDRSESSEPSKPAKTAAQEEEELIPSPEIQKQVAGFITGSGYWCGRVARFHEEAWDSTVNKKIYYAFCDDGSNAQAYILTFNGKGVLMSVKEK